MTVVDYLLEGLAQALEVERECGLRTVEIDRALLKVEETGEPAARSASAPYQAPVGRAGAPRTPPPQPPAAPKPREGGANRPTPQPSNSPTSGPTLDFVFLHHKALSAGGIEMMGKIITAMKKTPETAPIIFTGELPKAKVYVVLGGAAMNQWFPGMRAAPGKWMKSSDGHDVLITYSPEYILRFGPVTPTVQKIKVEMWTALKGVMQRVKS